ncbi:Mucin-4 [Microtus ochrogaster]|uniref:Mucin-4 n=1 Tax=Microtus ochrogaster TaxID=79684 RepID=A0A8J6G3F0_MICOH|nr:Mucin-4 [Microtus ochrogaster]
METSSTPQTTLTEVTTSSFSTSPSGSTPAQTVSQALSSPEETTNLSTSSASNIEPTISEVSTAAFSTDSTSGNTENTSAPSSQSSVPVNTDGFMTNSPNVLSTVATPITSTQELPTSSQNLHTETMETSSTPLTTLTEVTTSTFPPFTSGSHPAQTESQGTSTPEETTNLFTSIITNTKTTISEAPTAPISIDSTTGNTGITPPTASQSSIPVNTGVSITNSPNVMSTVTIPITTTQELLTSSQSLHTETMETSSTPQTTLTEVTTSSFSTSPSGSSPAQTVSQALSSPEETTNLSTSSASNIEPTISEVSTAAFSTDSTSGNTENTSAPSSQSSVPVNTDGFMTNSPNVLSTVTSPVTDILELPTFNNDLHRSTETSSTAQTIVTEVTTSSLSPFPSGSTSAETVSHGISSPDETPVPSSSTVTNTIPTTSEVPTTAHSRESAPGITAPDIIQSSSETATEASVTSSPQELSTVSVPITSSQELSASSHSDHTDSIVTSSPPQYPITEVSSSTHSSSPRGPTVTQAEFQRTPTAGETTSLSAHTMRSSPPSLPSTETTTVDSGYTSAVVTPSSPYAATQFSMTSSPQELSTVSTPITSTQELTTSSQSLHTGSMDTSSTPQTTHTEVTTSTFSTSPNGSTPAQIVSQLTSSPGETASLSSTVINTSLTSSVVATAALSTDSNSGNAETTSPTLSQSSTLVNTDVPMTNSPKVLSTITTPITMTQELTTSSQTLHTESMGIRSTPQTTLTEVSISTFSTTPSGSTSEQTVSHGPSSPNDTNNLSTSSIIHTNATTSEMPMASVSTVSSSGNTGTKSPNVSHSSTSVMTNISVTSSANVLSTMTTPITYTQEYSPSSQSIHNGSMEIGSTPHTTLTEVTPSSLSFSPSVPTMTQTVSWGTSSSGKITTPSASSRSHPPRATPDISTSPDFTSGNAGPTSAHVTRSHSIATSRVPSTTLAGQPTILAHSTSMQPSSTYSQSYQTSSMASSSTSQTSILTKPTTENHSSCAPGPTATDAPSHGTSSSGESAEHYPYKCNHVRDANGISIYSIQLRKYWNQISKRFSQFHICHDQHLSDKLSKCPVNDDHPHHLYSGIFTIFSEHPQWKHGDRQHTSHHPHRGHAIISFLLPECTHYDTDSFLGNILLRQNNYSICVQQESPTSSYTRHINLSRLHLRKRRAYICTRHQKPLYCHIKSSKHNSSRTINNPSPQHLYAAFIYIFSELPDKQHGVLQHISNQHPHKADHRKPLILCTWTHCYRCPFPWDIFLRNDHKLPEDRQCQRHITLFYFLDPYHAQHNHNLQVNSAPNPHFTRAGTVDFTSPLFKIQIGFPLGSSLRDSFYFTDNGQIIFPESDYSIFSYPNPPQGGFTGMEKVSMVAPFWDDADFSSSRGTIFYQEYNTLHDENNELIRKVESLIREFASDWSYKAKWTLKVTWFNVPAYPAQWNYGTNTYQAILSTDGSSSYALFLYQSGGMLWDVTQGLSNRVVMGFSSGDGYFENSPLILRPAMEKYRPDRFLNSKLGIRGLQLYRLHKEVKPNYRLKCLWWLESQPRWPGWSWGWSWGWSQLSCPCSWQQGRRDLRFWRMNTGWQYGSDRQLCSFSSGRGGVCCSYGRWGEFREGWRMHSPWQFEQEREAQKWCCHWNDKPSFCALYHRARPRLSCATYRPPRPAWTYGDPHITTLDNVTYTFNGLGDFLLVQAQDTNSSFRLEGRTAQTGSAKATNFIAFAAQYNTSSLASPITVQWFLEPSDTIRVLHNNQTVTFNTSYTDEDLPMFNTTGVLLTRNGSQVSASFDGSVTISVIALSNILHASSSLPEEYRNHTQGLLGVWNDNLEDDFRMPNGSTIPAHSSEETIFHYGMTWQINGTGLLGVRTDSLPSNFTPVFLSQLLNTSNEDVTSGCHGDPQCKFDALATGNITIGRNTNMIFEAFQYVNGTLNQYPPSIHCPSEIQAYRERTEIITITSNSKDVTFSLTNECSGFKLSALEDSLVCQSHSCPTNYCYNHGHCYISEAPGCQPTCTCPPAFTDTRCFLAGNDFTPTISKELPLRTIMLSLRENENASQADVNASVAYRLGTLDVRAFLWNSQVELRRISPSAQPSDKSTQHWWVVSHFQYRPRGPVIHFLNHQLIDAVVEVFLLQARSGRPKRSNPEARSNVTFFPISREDIQDVTALNLSMLDYYFLCDGYEGYKLVYSPQNGVTCVSPCSEGYCHNGGQCQHLPNGPQCSCASFTIYTSWGEHCEHLSVKLGAFFGILFGALGALLLLGILAFAAFHFCSSSMYKFSYPLASEL